MAITYIENWTVAVSGTGTSGSVAINAGDVVCALFVQEDSASVGTVAISNSGTALAWNAIATVNASSNCYVRGWYAIAASSESRTITVTFDGAGANGAIAVIVHAGADPTTPIPGGNIFSGSSGADISQSITPNSSGSALWFIAGDWAATNSYVAAANCTVDQTEHIGGRYTATLIRPTTQPRTTSAAFTIGETDTGGTIAWLAFEVQGPPSSPTINTQPADQTVYAGQTATFTISATTSGGTLHYQWKDDASNVGTDSSTYAPTTALSDSGSLITCDVSDDNGTTSSSAALLTVLPSSTTAWITA